MPFSSVSFVDFEQVNVCWKECLISQFEIINFCFNFVSTVHVFEVSYVNLQKIKFRPNRTPLENLDLNLQL